MIPVKDSLCSDIVSLSKLIDDFQELALADAGELNLNRQVDTHRHSPWNCALRVIGLHRVI
jgi:hypothetical protein